MRLLVLSRDGFEMGKGTVHPMAGATTDRVQTGRWRSLERWRATAFLIAGVLLVFFAALLGVEAFLDRATPSVIFGPAGFLVAMIGILGLYPTLTSQTPKLASAIAFLTVVAGVGWFVITGLSIGEIVGVLPPLEEVGVLGIAIILVAGIGMVLSYILCGIASFSVEDYSRIVGLLLLLPPTIFAVMFAGVAIGYTPAWSAFALGSGQALVHLALWVTFRTEADKTDRAEQTTTGPRHG